MTDEPMAVLAHRVHVVERDLSALGKHIDARFDRLEYVNRELYQAEMANVRGELDDVKRLAWWALVLVITLTIGAIGSELFRAAVP